MLYDEILKIYNDISNLKNTLYLLNWDQSVFIPKNGITARSNTIETVTRLIHNMITDDRFYQLISTALNTGGSEQLDPVRQEEIAKIKKEVDRERKIPAETAAELAKTTSLAMSAWEAAKISNNDEQYLPLLDKIIQIKKKITEYIGYQRNPYDALLDEYDSGLTYDYIKPLFGILEMEQAAILKKINASAKTINDDFLNLNYEVKKQWDFGLKILKQMRIENDSFRQDISAHPFTTRIGIGDVRITTNIKENKFKKGFFSTLHEGGHCLYDLTVGNKYPTSPFGILESLALHESQSRFYENIIGRSYEFWQFYYPELQSLFAPNLKNISLEAFYAAINKVENSPIRIEADELTYNLHILIRIELENALLNNEISISKINEFWNEKTHQLLGFYPGSKSEGYLQDIHWSDGLIGYFPTYTMGNLIAAQFHHYLKKEQIINDNFGENTFKKIFDWFDTHLYSYGSRYGSKEVVKKATGEFINPIYFIEYLKNKFNKLYEVE